MKFFVFFFSIPQNIIIYNGHDDKCICHRYIYVNPWNYTSQFTSQYSQLEKNVIFREYLTRNEFIWVMLLIILHEIYA